METLIVESRQRPGGVQCTKTTRTLRAGRSPGLRTVCGCRTNRPTPASQLQVFAAPPGSAAVDQLRLVEAVDLSWLRPHDRRPDPLYEEPAGRPVPGLGDATTRLRRALAATGHIEVRQRVPPRAARQRLSAHPWLSWGRQRPPTLGAEVCDDGREERQGASRNRGCATARGTAPSTLGYRRGLHPCPASDGGGCLGSRAARNQAVYGVTANTRRTLSEFATEIAALRANVLQ